METGESFWVSGVKENGEDRHWAGSGNAALSEYLKTIKASLDTSRCEVTNSQTPSVRLTSRGYHGWPIHPFEGWEEFQLLITCRQRLVNGISR